MKNIAVIIINAKRITNPAIINPIESPGFENHEVLPHTVSTILNPCSSIVSGVIFLGKALIVSAS